jgi:hypothetical protein
MIASRFFSECGGLPPLFHATLNHPTIAPAVLRKKLQERMRRLGEKSATQ